MKPHHVARLTLAFSAVIVSACETTRAARIREFPEHYAALGTRDRKLIDEGLFDLGFSAEAVFMSLGKPNKIATEETLAGPVEIWTYKNFLYGAAGAIIQRPNPALPSQPQRTITRNVPASNAPTAPASNPPPIPVIADPPHATLHLTIKGGILVHARIDP
ncbi:MAG: hypothetical protein RLZZ15_209 [Verrucomicrobiota bacterium]|jgi:hypothetical protein